MANGFVEKYNKAAEFYIKDLKYKGASETTINNYAKRTRYFREFWEKTEPTSDPTVADVREWRNAMLEKGTSPKTVKQYLIELGAFFEYTSDPKDVGRFYDANPVTKKLYPSLKGESSKPYNKILSDDSLKKLWSNKKSYGSEKFWARNYAIVMLLIDGKIRNSELLDLKLSDVDFEYNEIVISKGKGNKWRVVTLSDISTTALRLYLESGIRPADVSDDDYLFGTTAEKKFGGATSGGEWHRGSSQWLSAITERFVRNVTGNEGFRTHSLRHNGAILELNNGVSLERMQSELGHSSIQTTELYTGRMKSKRRSEGTREVIAERDAWAIKNKEMLAEAGI